MPRASRSEIVGELDGSLKVRLCAPPVGGAANTELIKLLAKSLGASSGDIEIVSGHTSKTKRIRIDGVAAAKLKSLIGG